MSENDKSDFDSIFGLKNEGGKKKPPEEVKSEEKPAEEDDRVKDEKPPEEDKRKTADDLFKEFRKDFEADEDLLELMDEKDKDVSELDEIRKEVEPKKKEPEVEEKTVSDEQPGIVLREGHIEIPADSNVRLIRKDGKISVVVGKGVDEMEIDGELIDLSKLTSGEGITFGGEEKGDVEDILKSIQESGLGEGSWVNESEGEEFIGEIRDDINLLDLRKEFMEREEEEDFEDEFEEEEGILDKIKGFVKKTTVEGREEKLVRLTMENLDKTGGMRDQRKATVAVACVLKEFLQIKFDINRELTYIELIQELRERDMDKKLRDSLVRFFKSTSIMMYANIGGIINYNKAINLAKSAVKELS